MAGLFEKLGKVFGKQPALRTDSTPPLPMTVFDWIDLVQRHLDRLPPETVALVRSHELHCGAHAITVFAAEIGQKLEVQFREHAAAMNDGAAGGDRTNAILVQVVNDIVRWKTIIQCRDAHTSGGYYDAAEPYMADQWQRVIEPIVRDLDFEHVLEVAPGHGRNTEFLRRRATSVQLVDVNASCIEACRQRFGTEIEGCRFFYHVTDGNSLPMIRDGSISLVYSFDSMVHFDKLVVRDYVLEFARVLQPGGCAFIHHSNLGATAPDSDWAHNVGNRSDMTADLMRTYAAEAGLTVRFQRLSGLADGWGLEDLDCFTVLERPGREASISGASATQ